MKRSNKTLVLLTAIWPGLHVVMYSCVYSFVKYAALIFNLGIHLVIVYGVTVLQNILRKILTASLTQKTGQLGYHKKEKLLLHAPTFFSLFFLSPFFFGGARMEGEVLINVMNI